MSIRYKIDLDPFKDKLEASIANIRFASGRVLTLEAEEIMRISKEQYVPVDTGNLRASGHVQPFTINGDKVSVVFGFGGPSAEYALAVHENPRAGKTKGKSPKGRKYKTWSKVGQWKYLETPLKERVPVINQNLVKNLRYELKRLLGGTS